MKTSSKHKAAELDAKTAAVNGAEGVLATLGGRIPSLDGWRAFSIGMVLASHSFRMKGFPPQWHYPLGIVVDGSLGVRVFFIISGFLITWLMIKEKEKRGSISLRRFYLRRALRILPVCYVYLLVVLLLSLTTPFSQGLAVWLSNLTFTTNFMLNRDWQGVPWTTIHLWSLAIEEQFYLLWPPLFLCFGFLRGLRPVAFLVAAALVVAPCARFVSHYKLYPAFGSWIFSPASFLNYFDGIALGCAGAVLVTIQLNAVRRIFCDYRFVAVAMCLAMIVTPHALRILKAYKMLVIPLGPTLQAVGFTGLIIQSVFLPAWGFYRVLNWPVARVIGLLSFSIYIWQQLFCSFPALFGWPVDAWWMTFPMAWGAAGFAAVLSYLLVERPFLGLRARLRPLA